MDRRNFLERSGRWTAGILLSLLGGYLAFEREIRTTAACGEAGICQQCLKNKACKKPPALEFRNQGQGFRNKYPHHGPGLASGNPKSINP